ncbi:hypothetical protein [Roseomonas fluvialis]|uniref:Uncharacterized protein n=1 Tax=Roseomonas fluvialis TaxID=1750527 RepID=A0ABN6NZK2_9PROT|nr:hypothetical protein [Roseomonas fluvialis]BDG71845.1 hypothetical protein Rmf_17740 [Roseomonas fluvialis]
MPRLPVLATLLTGVIAGPALACALPGRLELHNATGQRIHRLAITEDLQPSPAQPSENQLPSGGLLAGERVTVFMPYCVGRYTVTVQLADGTLRSFRSIDAARGTLDLK